MKKTIVFLALISFIPALDDSGNIYVSGHNAATWGSPVRAHSGGGDAFVVKLSNTIVSGTVTSGVLPLEGVMMSGLPGDPATDASGVYTAQVDFQWSGGLI